MKKLDTQLGKPSILYKGTTAELEAISAVEGMQAYDTTLQSLVGVLCKYNRRIYS